MKTTGPPRYYVPIFAGDPRNPLTWIGGPRAFVERTREQAEERPVVWVGELETETERKEKSC